jgi:protein translocase SecG subunit
MNLFNIFLIITSVLLIISILFQQRGAGYMGFTGTGDSAYHTKRGMEKMFFIASIILSVLFIGGAFVRLFI